MRDMHQFKYLFSYVVKEACLSQVENELNDKDPKY